MTDVFTEARKRQLARLGGARPPAPRAAMALAKSQRPTRTPQMPRRHCGPMRPTSQTTRLGATRTVSSPYRPRPRWWGPTWQGRAKAMQCRPCADGLPAIARASGVAGHPLDTKYPAIRETLRGIGRKHGSPARRAAAITTTEVRKLCQACDTGLAGARDRHCCCRLCGRSAPIRVGGWMSNTSPGQAMD